MLHAQIGQAGNNAYAALDKVFMHYYCLTSMRRIALPIGAMDREPDAVELLRGQIFILVRPVIDGLP
ncbi:MAG TPA: hypothetical protein DIS73_05190 [Planctomycetia bacterium]|nr:hypothetical protein [Planctomycetia bacterium]